MMLSDIEWMDMLYVDCNSFSSTSTAKSYFNVLLFIQIIQK